MSRATSSFSAALWGATWIILSGVCIQFADPQALLPHTAVLAASLTLLLAQGSFEWARERSLARSSVRLLERYVSGAVLKTLLKARNFDALKPRHTRITVLVVDLAGYSARVSEYSLEESTAFTRRLLEIMTGPVLSHGGTLDRYTGDGLVAFWGAPLAVPQAADRALQAALEIERLVRAELKASIRCGLATGEALVGDVGSAHRAHYTAVGGCINLAARLEALAKELGEQFLFDGATASELKSHKPESLGAREIRSVGEVELFAVTQQQAPEPTPTA
jgi:adenylate cyclase